MLFCCCNEVREVTDVSVLTESQNSEKCVVRWDALCTSEVADCHE